MDAVGLGVHEVLPHVGGMQQGLGGDAADCRQVPPSFGSFSTSAVFSPYWPARMAAE